MNKKTSRLSHPIRGLLHVVRTDKSFQSQIFAGLLLFFCVWLILSPLAAWEWLLIGLCWTLILITELQNSALEEALDRIHPELNENIGHSKDMAAGAVLLAAAYTITTIVVLSGIRFLT